MIFDMIWVYFILTAGIAMIVTSVYSAIKYLRPVERGGKAPHWDIVSSLLMFSLGCLITTFCGLIISG